MLVGMATADGVQAQSSVTQDGLIDRSIASVNNQSNNGKPLGNGDPVFNASVCTFAPCSANTQVEGPGGLHHKFRTGHVIRANLLTRVRRPGSPPLPPASAQSPLRSSRETT
ncbi:hypothetical protein BPA30113_02567 [Burkholderia paludis]|uniref:Uncharacterized protein n=1 Tax=Burkholderia paludis TaxID=1506587 RepID=A0A6P2KNA2_9BURK|nr:hypothetical protein LMG30113_04923 [Burkholderia paludis]VWB58324.1 hypothetical protein BPA30113_02567 [Burkholderia paludis]